MKQGEVALAFPCGRDFGSMSPAEGGRLCGECQTVVHDLSSMSEGAARALLASSGPSRLCVRYLYDANGQVRFAGDSDAREARIIPAFKLSARRRTQLARTALLAAPLVLFEACGGGPGVEVTQNWMPGQVVDPQGEAGDAGDAEAGHQAVMGEGSDAAGTTSGSR